MRLKRSRGKTKRSTNFMNENRRALLHIFDLMITICLKFCFNSRFIAIAMHSTLWGSSLGRYSLKIVTARWPRRCSPLLRGRSLFVRCLRFTESKSSSLISLYLKRTKTLTYSILCALCTYTQKYIYTLISKRQNIFAQSKYILIHYTERVQYLAYSAYIRLTTHAEHESRDFKNIIFWPDS